MDTTVGSVTIVIASIYFDIKRSIDEDFTKNASSIETRKRHRDGIRNRQ